MASMSFLWILFVALCATTVLVSAGKKGGTRPKVHLIANQTKVEAKGTTTAAPTLPPQTAPPPPPPPKNCDDDGKCDEKNKKCNAELKCVCDVHLREISDGTCVPKPQWGERCFDNVTWLECDGQGVDPNCFSGEGPNRGKCVCSKGHEPNKAEKNCSPITKKLGEACSHDAECFLAYSACESGKCTCIDGFSQGSDGTCKPNIYRCPTGEARKTKSGGVIPCEVDFNETTGEIGDNCGAGSFCFVPPHTLSNLGKPRGHCCPALANPATAQLVCPYGEPLSNATCPDKKAAGAKKDSTCPLSSHKCFALHSRPHDMICCQSPCRQSVSHFDYNGQCFDYVELGKPCELTAQCTGDAECAEASGKKVCRCKKGYTQASANQCEENSRR